jgi:CRP-like cAMP-binding protein
MYILNSGCVEVVDDEGQVQARLMPGAFFGETSIMMDVTRTENVKAVSLSEVYVLTRLDVQNAISAYPEMKERLERTSQRTYNLWKINAIKKVTLNI